MTTGEFEDCEDLIWDERTTRYELLEEELRQHPGAVATRRCNEAVPPDVGPQRHLPTSTTSCRSRQPGVGRDSQELRVEIIRKVRGPMVRDAFFAGLDQRLHSMPTGAVSLVNITRRLIKKSPESHFAHEFETRNSSVASRNLSGLPIGGRVLVVVHVPGHQPGSTTSHDENIKPQIIGDHAPQRLFGYRAG